MSIKPLLALAKAPYHSPFIDDLSNLLRQDLPVYLLGRNIDSLEVAKAFKFAAVIDDFVDLPLQWQGMDVIRLEQVPKHAIVINGVTTSRPRLAQERLVEAGYQNSFYLADFCYALRETLTPPGFVALARSNMLTDHDKWQTLWEKLEDAESKKVLFDVLSYKLTGDPRFLSDYEFRPEQQYFEDFLNINNEVFVDGGGYHGETAIECLTRYPDTQKVLFFEPDPENVIKAKRHLAPYSQVEVFALGLSDQEALLQFNAGDGASAAFVEQTNGQSSANGSSQIKVTALDAVTTHASFIKLDLEGWELKALQGAKQNLIDNKPKLALGLYHSPKDMCTVFEWLEQHAPGYRYRLRHYTQSWTETILYAY